MSSNPLGISQLLPSPQPPSPDNADDYDCPSSIVPSSSERWVMKLFSADCLDCNSLVENGENDGAQNKCHFKNNNPHCPAAEIKVEFVGAKVIALSRVRKAKELGHAEFLKQMAWLQTKDESIQQYVLIALGFVEDPKAIKPVVTSVQTTTNNVISTVDADM